MDELIGSITGKLSSNISISPVAVRSSHIHNSFSGSLSIQHAAATGSGSPTTGHGSGATLPSRRLAGRGTAASAIAAGRNLTLSPAQLSPSGTSVGPGASSLIGQPSTTSPLRSTASSPKPAAAAALASPMPRLQSKVSLHASPSLADIRQAARIHVDAATSATVSPSAAGALSPIANLKSKHSLLLATHQPQSAASSFSPASLASAASAFNITGPSADPDGAEEYSSPAHGRPRARIEADLATLQEVLAAEKGYDDLDRWLQKHSSRPLWHFDRHHRRELRRFFRALDTDGSGEVELAELEGPLLSTGLVHNHVALEQMFKVIDTNKSGAVDFSEFVAAFKPLEARRGGRVSKEEAMKLHSIKKVMEVRQSGESASRGAGGAPDTIASSSSSASISFGTNLYDNLSFGLSDALTAANKRNKALGQAPVPTITHTEGGSTFGELLQLLEGRDPQPEGGHLAGDAIGTTARSDPEQDGRAATSKNAPGGEVDPIARLKRPPPRYIQRSVSFAGGARSGNGGGNVGSSNSKESGARGGQGNDRLGPSSTHLISVSPSTGAAGASSLPSSTPSVPLLHLHQDETSGGVEDRHHDADHDQDHGTSLPGPRLGNHHNDDVNEDGNHPHTRLTAPALVALISGFEPPDTPREEERPRMPGHGDDDDDGGGGDHEHHASTGHATSSSGDHPYTDDGGQGDGRTSGRSQIDTHDYGSALLLPISSVAPIANAGASPAGNGHSMSASRRASSAQQQTSQQPALDEKQQLLAQLASIRRPGAGGNNGQVAVDSDARAQWMLRDMGILDVDGSTSAAHGTDKAAWSRRASNASNKASVSGIAGGVRVDPRRAPVTSTSSTASMPSTKRGTSTTSSAHQQPSPSSPDPTTSSSAAAALSIPLRVTAYRRRFVMGLITRDVAVHAGRKERLTAALNAAHKAGDGATADAVREQLRLVEASHRKRMERMAALGLVLDKELTLQGAEAGSGEERGGASGDGEGDGGAEQRDAVAWVNRQIGATSTYSLRSGSFVGPHPTASPMAGYQLDAILEDHIDSHVEEDEEGGEEEEGLDAQKWRGTGSRATGAAVRGAPRDHNDRSPALRDLDQRLNGVNNLMQSCKALLDARAAAGAARVEKGGVVARVEKGGVRSARSSVMVSV